MGHAFITLGDRHVHLHDLVIEPLRHFLLITASRVPSSEVGLDAEMMNQLRAYFSSWENVGPGVWLGTDLGNFIQQDDRRRAALTSLFRRTVSEIKAFGDSIPLEYVSANAGALPDYAVPVPTSRFASALERLIGMLTDAAEEAR